MINGQCEAGFVPGMDEFGADKRLTIGKCQQKTG
ncbi:MAG: hypothetical protein ACI9JL_000997 [Paracoccaceae bacterium]|jgi:hypothetical protein